MIEDLLKQIEDAMPEARPTLEEMRATYAAKGADYSQGGPSLANLRACEHVGVPAWKGALIRLSDKKQRIGSFVARGTYAVADEQVGDTLLDAASSLPRRKARRLPRLPLFLSCPAYPSPHVPLPGLYSPAEDMNLRTAWGARTVNTPPQARAAPG